MRPFIAYKKSKTFQNLKIPMENTTKESFDYEYFKNEYQKLEERLKI